MQLCDKTAYVRGLRYRWVPLLSRNSLLRFLHLMPPCIRPNQSLLSGKPCPSLPAHNATFALKHSGQNACGIPEGQTIIMTWGGNSDGCHNFVTRWAISFNIHYCQEKLVKKWQATLVKLDPWCALIWRQVNEQRSASWYSFKFLKKTKFLG